MSLSESFERGLGIGEKYGKHSSLRDSIKGVLDKYNQQQDLVTQYGTKGIMEQAFQDPLDKRIKEATLKEKEASASASESTTNFLEKLRGGGDQTGKPVLRKITVGGMGFDVPQTEEEMKQEEDSKRRAQGIPAAEIGKVSLAQESIKNIEDIKKILFPDGTPKSFQRNTATWSNIPGATAPVIGAVIPERGVKANEQDVYRKMGAALSGRQLIQTGVAARPEETAKLVGQFSPGLFSNSTSALRGLNELQDFYRSYLNTVSERSVSDTPTSRYVKTGTKSDGTRVGQLPDGTIEVINE